MNRTFMLLDKNNDLVKQANMVVKFNFEDKDYLVYSVEENEQNNQIFVSKLILNSEGNYFIDNILPEDKSKLSNIVYNIVILLPTDNEKGNDFQSLINNLFNKFSVKLLNGLPDIDKQEYYSNCSIAITNKVLVENAIKLYDEKLNPKVEKANIEVPTWTAPVEVTAPTPLDDNKSASVDEPTIVSASIPVQESVVEPSIDEKVISENITPVIEQTVDASKTDIETPVVTSEKVNSVPTPVPSVMPVVDSVSNDVVLPNPQAEKLAIVSDPSLGIGVQQPNIMQNKKAGFANTKYIVIGTVCLVLAIAVVITAYILIKNMG